MARDTTLNESEPGLLDQLRLAATILALSVLAIGLGGGAGLVMMKSLEDTIIERYKAQREEAKPIPSKYVGDIELRKIPAVIANLANSTTDWVRIESSIVFTRDPSKPSEIVVAEIRQDLVAYLRSVSLAQIQGSSGLMHLREDMNERAKLRSNGKIQEIIVETLVVQ